MGTSRGIVMRSTGSWYRVRREGSGDIVECRIRGRLRLGGSRTTNPVAVGDSVEFECRESGESVITNILERRNYIIRRASNLSKESHIIAANIDRVLLVVSLSDPVTSYEFIDRFLVTCEAYRIPATLLLNKIDLAPKQPEALAEFRRTYRLAGYDVIEASATEGINIEMIKRLTAGSTTLISGNSGVGKSSVIKAVDPTIDLRIGEVSKAHGKGRHTTTFSQVYPLSQGGYIIDTPGIKGFGLIDLAPDELCRYFPDLMRFSPDCRYYNCTHIHEPECAVTAAVAEGKIAFRRYESYLKMVDEDGKYRI